MHLRAGPKAFAKFKAHLGDDCFLTEEMVCCGVKQVGDAEKRWHAKRDGRRADVDQGEERVTSRGTRTRRLPGRRRGFQRRCGTERRGACLQLGLRRANSTAADSTTGTSFRRRGGCLLRLRRFRRLGDDGVGPSAGYQAMPSAPGSTVKLIDPGLPSDAAEAEKREAAKDAAAERKRRVAAVLLTFKQAGKTREGVPTS